MPIKIKLHEPDNTCIIVWEVTEENSYFIEKLNLSEEAKSTLKSYSPKRSLEWLSIRYLLTLLSPAFSYDSLKKDQYGKPYIVESKRQVSISHSHQYAALVISDKVVGIDIQKSHDNIRRIAHKFINEEEFSHIENKDEELIRMHINWGAKESMYKAYGKKALSFKQHMHVNNFNLVNDTSVFTGSVKKGNVTLDFTLKSLTIDNYILVYAIEC